ILAIVVATGVTVLMAGASFLTQGVATFSETVQRESTLMKEEFTVVDVWFNSSDPAVPTRDLVHIVVYNYGSIPIEVDDIFLNNELVAVDLRTEVEHARFATITVNATWTEDQDYLLRVATVRGSSEESTWRSPSLA
ncbi:MAG: hypothetical protein ACE5PO_06195, partial [Candidatus Bathyarchaeia archaeon]